MDMGWLQLVLRSSGKQTLFLLLGTELMSDNICEGAFVSPFGTFDDAPHWQRIIGFIDLSINFESHPQKPM